MSGGIGPEGVANPGGNHPDRIMPPDEAGRTKPWPATQGSASLVFTSRSNDIFFPNTVQAGFNFERFDLADLEPTSVPQGALPLHCMATVDGIDHDTWIYDAIDAVDSKVVPFSKLYSTFGVDLLGHHAPSKGRGRALSDNIVKPLVKRFFTMDLKFEA